MDSDSSDILGQKTMPVARGSSSAGSSFSVTRLIFIGVVLLVGYAIGLRLWKHILLWRERSYKLATRRRHGIPDSDLRPFNVAYSEAVTRAREDESKKLSKPRPAFRPQAPATSLDQREAQPDQNLRQRSAVAQRSDPGLRSTAGPVPGGFNSVPPQSRSTNELHSGHAFTNPYGTKTVTTYSQPSGSRPLSRQGGYANLEDLSDIEGKKRSWDDEQEGEHEAKKTRVEGDELIDGDEDAEFTDAVPKRGSKRGIRDEEDSEEVKETKKTRGKRARKVSQEKSSQGYQADQSMDIDEEEDEEADEITELKSTSYRGKKRDRAEAGSTFGGDDDDSAGEHEAEGDLKARRRRRKRRTVAKRKSEVTYLREKQRHHDGGDDFSDEKSDDSSPSKVSVRRRPAKRSSLVDRYERERSKSDVSMDESITSTRTKARDIGDEWESNGIKYKIGLNGQKLRQALVKKARQKFVMPKDSQHPDRDANLQVCIECWLTEEEYQQAKADHMLAWQDSPKRSEENEKLSLDTSQGVQFPQSGKNLLWSTSTSTTPTISPASSEYGYAPESTKPRSYRNSYRHSIATTVGLPISPFVNSTMPTVKRIASSSRALSLTSSINGTPGLSDSTNGSPRTPHKVFSKWEKQELEAKAMMKVREANRKKEMEKESKLREEKEAKERVEREKAAAAERLRQEKERAEKERQEREKAAKEKAELEKKAKELASVSAASTVPSITVTAPSAAPTPASSFTTPSAPQNFFGNPSATAPRPAASAAPTAPTPAPSFFSNPPGSTTPASATETKPPSLFSFGPTSATTPAPTPAASAPKPPTFSFSNSSTEQKKENVGSSGGSSLLSRLGAPAQEPAKLQTQATQPMFSFPKPETSTAPPPSAFPSTTPTATPSATTAPGTAAQKFSFNFNKSAATSTTPGNTSSLTGALGAGGSGAEAKPPTIATSGPTFNFKTPTTAASGAPTTNGTSTSGAAGATTAPKFSFGPSLSPSTPATSPFGGGAKEPAKSAFGTTSAFGNTGSSTSAFGNGSSAFGNTSNSGFGTSGGTSGFGKSATPSAFGGGSGNTTTPFGGSSSTSSAFGGGNSGPSPFGASTSTPSAFGTSTTPAAASNTPNGASKSGFSFGTPSTTPAGSTTPSGTPAAAGSSGFSFNFGGAKSTTPQSSPFGTAASSGTSMFGGGTNGTTTPAGTPSVFGGGAFGGSTAGQQK